jgi:hypothetical protein
MKRSNVALKLTSADEDARSARFYELARSLTSELYRASVRIETASTRGNEDSRSARQSIQVCRTGCPIP